MAHYAARMQQSAGSRCTGLEGLPWLFVKFTLDDGLEVFFESAESDLVRRTGDRITGPLSRARVGGEGDEEPIAERALAEANEGSHERGRVAGCRQHQ